MDKEKIEQILVEYGVSFTDALADRLMKEFKQEPKTGHWIRLTDKTGHFLIWKCDKCGLQHQFNTNFCPDCGCAMVEQQENEG